MSTHYPVTDFLRHNTLWAEKYARASTIELPNGTSIEMPTENSPETQVIKIRCMMSEDGVDTRCEPYISKVFHLTWIFWVHHQDALFEKGWIRLNDGEQAVLRDELLRALHHSFNVFPVPMPTDVSLKSVLNEADRISLKVKTSL